MTTKASASSQTLGEDEALTQFIDTYVNSFIKWDLLRFFHENPHTIDSEANIARYVGREVETVSRELTELAEQGILEHIPMDKLAAYALTSRPALRQQLTMFIYASEDQNIRSQIIFKLLRTNP